MEYKILYRQLLYKLQLTCVQPWECFCRVANLEVLSECFGSRELETNINKIIFLIINYKHVWMKKDISSIQRALNIKYNC